MKTEWSDDIVLLLIHEIENLPVLWNSTDPCFKITRKKNEAWEMLSLQFNRTAEDVKKKWQSLLASYRRERGKESGCSGTKPSKKIKSTWFAFKAMSFFGGRYKPRLAYKSEVSNTEYEDESTNDDDWEDEADEVKNEDTEVTVTTDPLTKITPTPYIDPRRSKRPALVSSNSVPAKMMVVAEDSRVNEFCEIQRTPAPKNDNERDEFVIYGEYVASKLRKLDSRSSTVAQHYINKTLFEAELGRYKELFLDNNE